MSAFDGVVDGLFDGERRGAGEFDEFVNGVGHNVEFYPLWFPGVSSEAGSVSGSGRVETTSWGGSGDVFFRFLRSGWESEWGSVGFQGVADEWAGRRLALVRGVRLMRVWKGGVSLG